MAENQDASPASIPLVIDPQLPPGTVLIRTGNEQALMDTTSAGIFQDPALAGKFTEDLESLKESMPYMVRYLEATGPIPCESCGTTVHAVPESEYVKPRRWRRAIWEPATGRKHTVRRCDRIRRQALGSLVRRRGHPQPPGGEQRPPRPRHHAVCRSQPPQPG